MELGKDLHCTADHNWQATVGQIDKDKLLDLGLCVGWDHLHPYGYRITGKKSQLLKFFETQECITYSEMEVVQRKKRYL